MDNRFVRYDTRGTLTMGFNGLSWRRIVATTFPDRDGNGINLRVLRPPAGKGEAPVQIAVDGKTANIVTLMIT
jgi:hypothetical protein